jgi:hypothetical protein
MHGGGKQKRERLIWEGKRQILLPEVKMVLQSFSIEPKPIRKSSFIS